MASTLLKPACVVILLSLLISSFFTQSAYAQSAFTQSAYEQSVRPVENTAYIARIELHTAEELMAALQRSNDFFDASDLQPVTPIAFVLHGPEAKVFFREHYKKNQQLVDLAAKLTALKMVDIKVCKVWMGSEGLTEGQLMPFVGTVSIGPVEEQRLLKQQSYRYF